MKIRPEVIHLNERTEICPHQRRRNNNKKGLLMESFNPVDRQHRTLIGIFTCTRSTGYSNEWIKNIKVKES